MSINSKIEIDSLYYSIDCISIVWGIENIVPKLKKKKNTIETSAKSNLEMTIDLGLSSFKFGIKFFGTKLNNKINK